jgi:hypothetical protein
MDEKTGQEALNKLRQERKVFIDRAKSRIKEQSGLIKKIKEHLTGDGETIPEIAGNIGMKPSEVLWFVMALKKYGQVAEGAKEGDYFKYQLTNPKE